MGVFVGSLGLCAGGVGCAGFGESLAGVCLAIALQSAAEVCCEAAVGAVCDETFDIEDDDQVTAVEEVPPPGATADGRVEADAVGAAEVPQPQPCRQRELPGGVWRLDCVDGTAAEALVRASLPGDGAADIGDVASSVGGHVDVINAAVVGVTGLDDVARLAAVRGLAGSLHIGGPALLSLTLPSLRTVGGDLVVERTVHLASLRVDGLRRVDGTLRVVHNRALSADLFPVLVSAGAVDVAFNDALAAAVVDRLLVIGPPPLP